jgi:type IV pilus assembly protein PilE
MARSGEEVSTRRFQWLRPDGGFTLLELLIAVAVVALLAAIALPSYQEHLRKAKRAEGKTALLKAIQLEERAYTSNGQYQTDLGPLFGLAAGVVPKSGEDPSQGNYDLTAAADPANGNTLAQGVVVTATPRSGVFSDPDCNVLTLSSVGQKTASGTKGAAFCW